MWFAARRGGSGRLCAGHNKEGDRGEGLLRGQVVAAEQLRAAHRDGEAACARAARRGWSGTERLRALGARAEMDQLCARSGGAPGTERLRVLGRRPGDGACSWFAARRGGSSQRGTSE